MVNWTSEQESGLRTKFKSADSNFSMSAVFVEISDDWLLSYRIVQLCLSRPAAELEDGVNIEFLFVVPHLKLAVLGSRLCADSQYELTTRKAS